VKPAVKEDFFYATGAKAWRANNRQELKALFLRAAKHVNGNEILIQEIIPGDGRCQFSSCVFFKKGRIVASLAAQRRRQHPPEFGRSATFVQTVKCPELTAPTSHFLKAIDYYGLAELEYKLDPRDGKYKLLDVNARTWGFHCLGSPAGVDFSYLLFADQVGDPLPVCHGRAGVSWVRMVTDVPTSLKAIASGKLDPRAYVKSLSGSGVESVFSQEDILPSVVELALLPYLLLKRGF
jgi:predicted ATP-grasp superfamily ATP-dependent carboligase